MRRIFAAVFVALVGIAVPLTVDPSATVLIVLWSLIGVCLVGIVATSPVVSDRIWTAISARVARHDPAAEAAGRQAGLDLRVAVGRLIAELEEAKPILDRNDHEFFSAYKLPDIEWKQHGDALAAAGKVEAHRSTRRAYRAINEVNRDLEYVQAGHDIWHPRIKPERRDAALEAISDALAALEGLT